MERRFRVRLDELLDDAEVPPGLLRGVLPRLEAFLQPFVDVLAIARATDQRPALRPGAALRPGQQGRRVDRLPPRPRTPGPAEVHRPGRLGPPAPADRAGPPGRQPSWASPTACSSSTPRPSPRRGPSRSACSGSGAAGSARSRTARSASTSATSRAANTPWSMSGSTCPRSGPTRKRRRQKAGVPADGPLPHAARAGPGDARRARRRCCRTPGSPATTRWAAPRGSASNCGRAASATCWRCRRTRWSAT